MRHPSHTAARTNWGAARTARLDQALTLLAGCLLAFGLGLGVPARASDVRCIPDWSVAAQIVEKRKLAPVTELSRSLAAQNRGRVLTTTLCREDGRFVYRLTLRAPGGRLETVTLDAKSPFGR